MKSFFSYVILMFSISICNAQVVINELMASNTWTITDADFGNYADWIEIKNVSDTTVDLTGYTISDNIEAEYFWSFPEGTKLNSGQCLLLFADDENARIGDSKEVEWKEGNQVLLNYHLNFKLKQGGETIILFNSTDQIVDQISYTSQISDYSYARLPNDSFGYTGSPTPGLPNSTEILNTKIVSNPVVFETQPKSFNGQIDVVLSSQEESIIRYTTDGTIPTESSTLYSSSISLDKSTTIRARSWENGKLPSDFLTGTFSNVSNIKLPIVYLTISENDLQNDRYGIYTNNRKDLDVPASIELFDTVGTRAFGINAETKLFGSTIFQLPQKPFSFNLKSKYGDDLLGYQLFKDRKHTSYTSFVLRNGGNDYPLTKLRDGFLAELGAQIEYIDYMAYQPCLVFLNNEFWGIYNLREKMNEEYLSHNHNISPNHLDILEDSLKVNAGDSENFESLIEFMTSVDLSEDQNYKQATEWIDMPAFMHYMILKSYIGYTSYVVNNKYWLDHNGDQKWRWMSFDLEHAFGCCDGDAYQENTLSFYLNEPQTEFSLLFFQKLWTNKTFKTEFLQRYSVLLQTTFNPDNVIELINKSSARIQEYMPAQINKWGSPTSMQNWFQEINVLHDYANARYDVVKQQVIDMTQNEAVNVQINIEGEGKVVMNNIPLSLDSTDIQVLPLEMNIIAVPEPGYAFVEWMEYNNSKDTLNLFLYTDTVITAVFKLKNDNQDITGEINNVLILDNTEVPYRFYGNTYINATSKLIIKPGVTLEMAEYANIIVKGSVEAYGEVDSLITIKAENNVFWGNVILEEAFDTCSFQYVDFSGSSIGENPLKNYSTISSYNSPLFVDHCSFIGSNQAIFSEGGTVQLYNSEFYNPFTGDNINIINTSNPIVSNCEIRGNNEPDTDAIDYDNVKDGVISYNLIYGFNGDNSDAIDLGEGSTGIIIEGNEIYYVSDKAFSVGQGSNVEVSNNLIILCGQGIGVKDFNSSAEVNFNTFYANKIAVASFEKNAGVGGGNVIGHHNIIYDSDDLDFYKDENSVLRLDNSLTENVTFKNAANFNLELLKNDSLIGYSGSFYQEKHPLVFINEINYQSSEMFDTKDWIEIYNASQKDLICDNWSFSDGENVFHFPSNTTILADSFLVLTRNKDAFSFLIDPLYEPLGNFDFNLNKTGERLYLFNENGLPINTVYYNKDNTWKGDSIIVLQSFLLDNTLGTNWRKTSSNYGTPGFNDDDLNTMANSDDSISLYPNPAKNYIRLSSSAEYKIFDLLGQIITEGKAEKDEFINISNINTGLYLLRTNHKILRFFKK